MIGKAYGAKRDLRHEIEAYREAIGLKADYAEAYSNLGRALNDNRDPEGAIEACRKAISLRDLPESHLNLGNALAQKGDPDEAIQEYGVAIRLLSDTVAAHTGPRTGRAAHDAGILALAYHNMGCALEDKGDRDEAILAYRQAIGINPKDARAHYSLANALFADAKHDEAILEYGEAIRLREDFAEALCGLGRAMMAKGRFEDAVPPLRKGHELGSKRPGWKRRSKEWLETAERRAEIERRLDDVVAGKARPRDANERIEFALVLCAKARHPEAARLYADALAEDPKLAGDPTNNHRYDAACAACMAAARGGADAAEWRGRALEWLRADLRAREGAGLVATLDAWKRNPDLASARDHVGGLPAAEREGWSKLWADVDALLARRN
jgi:tetratricopeptide (TPR) repeat protein